MTSLIGRAPEELLAGERAQANGLWVALEVYDPVRLPLRKIVAVGKSARDVLEALGTEAGRFEVIKLKLNS